MTFYEYLAIGITVVFLLIVLVFAIRTKKFFRTIFTSAAFGLVTLLILYFTYPFTGFKIELTPMSIGTSGVFGLPGVICIALCKMILGI